jgi:uncharacterized protein (UPF0276 family)
MGIGWRPELALFIERRQRLGFVEILAEDFMGPRPDFATLDGLRERGLAIVPHGISLSLGGAEPPDKTRLKTLADLACRVEAPLVSEHLAFVRAGELESGHLLPLPRTRESLRVVIANVQRAADALRVPLALENIATLFEWPENEMDEATFLTEVLDRTGVSLLLDVSNLHANSHNHGWDPIQFLDAVPLERIAYVHIAGGFECDGLYHDSHAHPVQPVVIELLEEVCSRTHPRGVLLEQDDRFPTDAALAVQLDAVERAVAHGASRRKHADPSGPSNREAKYAR